jgi:hypothetical protein
MATVLVVVVSAQAQEPVPSFSKVFVPSTIGPGSVATVRFTITNQTASPVSNLAFPDNLPAGVVIANPANAATSCGGTLSAPAGGGSISFSDGGIGAAGSCTILVDVTSSTAGTHMNVTGDLTSSAGNSGPASADLVVATDRPGFTKSFAPSSVPLGGRSTLTFTIDNTANPSAATNLTLTDNLPTGMVLAGPANTATTCTGGILTATAGTGVVTYSPTFFGDAAVAAMASCTVSVDVIGGAVGLLGNTSGELTSITGNTTVSSGKSSATLEVTVDPISLVKYFTDDPVPAGGTVTLEFTVANFDRINSAANISFTDDLDATLSGLVATGLPAADVCGAGSSLSGTSLLTLTGGNLAAGGSCTFSATLQIPAGAATGAYPNTTSSITADIGGSGVVGSPGVDIIFVSPAPVLTKEFTDDPVGTGGTVNLRFSVTNSSATSPVTNIEFIDELTTFLGFPVSVTLPGTPCGAGSSIALISLGTDRQGLLLTAGDLSAGGSCTFDVGIDVPVGQPSGAHTNITTPISATVDAETVFGSPAMDDLVVVAGTGLLKEFTDDPVDPGDTVTLEFTLTHDPNATADATGIAFTDDLDATLSGLVATGLPMNDVCGAGSQISGTSSLNFTGGTLAPGASCTFSVTLQVPGSAAVGPHTNTTSDVTATVAGLATTENPASDDLLIAALVLTKEFTDDPVFPGGAATLRFTIENVSTTSTATAIFFRDDLDTVISGLSASGLPLTDPCGAGSSLNGSSGDTLLSFIGGTLAPGGSCFFDVVLQVPVGAPSGTYPNTTTLFSATIESTTTPFPNAADVLVVSSDRLAITKSFTDDPVRPGASATLEFTIANLDTVQSATAITFTDDLDAALSGLAATGTPMNDICGVGSQISGTSFLTLTGGTLPAGGSCTFSVPVQVPAAAPADAHTNLTSQVTGNIGGFPVTGPAAMDDLLVLSGQSLSISKSFTDDPVNPGDTATLGFTITNLDGASNATAIAFTDDLDAALAGLVATGLPMNDVCGTGSQISGAGLLTLTGGALASGTSCTFSVPLQVPAAATPGAHTNVTSQVTGDIGGFPVAGDPATDDLQINGFTFGKTFGGPVPAGDTTALTFTIENLDANAGVADISFTDDLDAMVPGMVAVGLPATDVCGAGSLLSGTSLLTLTGGNLGPAGSCTFAIDVVIPSSTTPGTYVNTTSDLFELGLPAGEPATADLEVQAAAMAAIPVTSPIGTLILIALIALAAIWRLRWSV